MFRIDSMSRTPVYEQIVNQVEKFIAAGLMKSGDRLPSVRSLSVELSVNPNTIQKAFGELLNKGLIASVPGKGSFISSGALDIINNKNREKTDEFTLLARKLLLAGMTESELNDLVRDASVQIKQTRSIAQAERSEEVKNR